MSDDDRYLLPSLRTGRQLAPHSGFRPPVTMVQRRPTTVAKFRYLHPDEGDDPREDAFVLRDSSLAARIAEAIDRAYPLGRYLFDGWVETETGVVQIRLHGLMERACYICHVSDLECDPGCTQAVKGFGELLERFFLPRDRLDRDTVRERMDQHPTWCRAPDEVPGGSYANPT